MLAASGASTWRASAALKRSKLIVRLKARERGFPFPTEAELRAKRRRDVDWRPCQNTTDASLFLGLDPLALAAFAFEHADSHAITRVHHLANKPRLSAASAPDGFRVLCTRRVHRYLLPLPT